MQSAPRVIVYIVDIGVDPGVVLRPTAAVESNENQNERYGCTIVCENEGLTAQIVTCVHVHRRQTMRSLR
jgi:hypothetical protein